MTVGLISRNEADRLRNNIFTRDSIVSISYQALSVKLKSKPERLIDRLIAEKAVNRVTAIQLGFMEANTIPSNFPYGYSFLPEDDEYVYQAHAMPDKTGIYKIDKVSEVSTKIYDKRAEIICVSDEWIYFSNLEPAQLPDTKDKLNEKSEPSFMKVTGTCRMDKSGNNLTQLTEKDIYLLHCGNKGIAYMESVLINLSINTFLKYLPHDNSTSTTITQSFRPNISQVHDDKIFFYFGETKEIGVFDFASLTYKKIIIDLMIFIPRYSPF